jgi:two-component system, cell cycle response regulator
MFAPHNGSVNILVVEPTRLFQEMIEQMLAANGLSAVYCTTAQEALTLAAEQDFALVLVANELADDSGIYLAKKLRKLIKPSSAILLLISASQKNIIKLALQSGITEVLERHLLHEVNIYLDDLSKVKQKLEHQTIKVLSVEDSIPMGQLTENFLTKSGFQVTTVRSAEQSLTCIDEQRFDILITDLLLNGKMSGMALIRHVRHKPSPCGHLPILAVSGFDHSDQRIEALKQGANDFITKPVNLTELGVRVRNLVRTNRLYLQLLAKEAQLKAMAVTDPLTQLYNRHYFTEVGFKCFSEAQRHGHALSMLVIDLDHFKSINDQHGHLVGDAILQQVARILKYSCRQEDFAVRFGGEEFVLILPYSSPVHAQQKAEQLRIAIADLRPEGLSVTVSIGVAGFDEQCGQEQDFTSVLQRADDAVFQAKTQGRNQVCLCSHTKPAK